MRGHESTCSIEKSEKERLSRHVELSTALRLVDALGLDGRTMHRLAVEPGSRLSASLKAEQ
jgi:hypothetical protein